MSGFGFRIGPGRMQRPGPSGPAPAPSAVALLAVMDATPIDPSTVADAGVGIGVDGDGWTVRLRVPFEEGATFDPARIVLNVSDPGFDGEARTIERVRTIRGGAILRRQYPHQAERLARQDGDMLDVMFSLDDDIYAGTTIVEVRAEAGYYGSAADGIVRTPENGSTRAYPRPLFAFLNVPHERATGLGHAVEAVAYHRHAMNGRQVACIAFEATDESGNSAGTQLASQPALSDIQTQGQIVEAYKAIIPLGGLDQGEICQVNACVYPWIGDASAVLDLNEDGVDWPTSDPWSRLRFLNDKDGSYGGGIAFVRAGATGGVVAMDEAAARAAPFPSIVAALTAIRTFNAANRGHDDHSGGTINLMDGVAGADVEHEPGGNMNGVAAGKCLTLIRRDPMNVGKASVRLDVATRSVPWGLCWEVDIRQGSGGFILQGNASLTDLAVYRHAVCADQCQQSGELSADGVGTQHDGCGDRRIRRRPHAGAHQYRADRQPVDFDGANGDRL